MNMQTTVHHFRFDLRNDDEAKAYKAMVSKIEANAPEARGRKLHAIPMNSDRLSHKPGSRVVQIQSDHIFGNQWNSTEERLFDWYEAAIYINGREQKHAKQGHWLEITPEMSHARSNCHRCGYCGHSYGPLHTMPIPADGFCNHCLNSKYLKETELYLLRLLPLVGLQTREKLSQEETNILMPRYIQAQTQIA